MTTALDDELRPLVLQLIAEFGAPGVMNVSSGSRYDPSSGLNVQKVVSYNIQVTPPAPANDYLVASGVYQKDDMTCWVAAKDLPFVLAVGQDLVFGGRHWKVINVRTVYSGTLPCAYRLQVT